MWPLFYYMVDSMIVEDPKSFTWIFYSVPNSTDSTHTKTAGGKKETSTWPLEVKGVRQPKGNQSHTWDRNIHEELPHFHTLCEVFSMDTNRDVCRVGARATFSRAQCELHAPGRGVFSSRRSHFHVRRDTKHPPKQRGAQTGGCK